VVDTVSVAGAKNGEGSMFPVLVLLQPMNALRMKSVNAIDSIDMNTSFFIIANL